MPVPPDCRRPLARLLRVSGLCALSLAAALATETRAQASPPGDWSIEARADDDVLVQQRFAKLRKNPFDGSQWRALQKAIGKRGLANKIRSAAGRAPSDSSLQILLARVELEEDQPRAAAQRLAPIVAADSRWSSRAFDMRIDALGEAGLHADAVTALRARAQTSEGKTRNKHLLRAYELADRGNLSAEALAIAETMATEAPDDSQAQVRLARAATAAKDAKTADAAWARAADKARGARRDELIAERARSRAENRDLDGASELLWGLLHDAEHGRSSERARWWEMLMEVHRRDASGEVLAAKVEAWLETPAHAKDAEAWKALAAARNAAGLDAIEAWKKAIELDARDTEARAALIGALEAEGEAEAALEQYQELSGRSAEEVQLGLEMARRLLTNGERETGMQIVGEIESRAGRNAHTLLLLLDFYNGEGEHQKALEIAKRLVSAKSRNPEARIAYGEQLYEMGQREQALAQWAMLPKLVRPSHEGHARHAEILSGHARSDRNLARQAREEIEKALRSRPKDPNYLRLRATLLTEQRRSGDGETIDAWEDVRRAATGPEHALLREEARTRLVELVQPSISPCNAVCAARRDMYVRTAREELSGEDRERALEAGLFLAAISTKKSDHAAAASVHRDLVALFPEDPERYLALARAQVGARDYDAAVATLEKALDLHSNRDIELLTELSEVAFMDGDLEAAETAARRAAKLGADGAAALLALGDSYRRRGKLEAAERAYAATLEAAPRNAEARTALADLQLNRGDLDSAAATYRGLLEAGGSPELMRDAGRRALDLAESSGTLDELLDLAVRRTKREPENDEPREFLLDTLDRVGMAQVEGWLRGGPASAKTKTKAKTKAKAAPRDAARSAALRRALISGLNRGPIRIRLRCAQQLGELGLPDSAEPLARVGANLSPPRDATSAIRNAFDRVRGVAIVAAGQLADPAAVPTLLEVLEGGSYTTREASAWALARIGDPASREGLRRYLERQGGEETSRALACLGLALHDTPAERADDLQRIRTATDQILGQSAKRACVLAAATMTPASRRDSLIDALDDAAADTAAIAAWRLGQLAGHDDEIYTALFRAYFGPAGRRRDAAAAALSRRMRQAHPKAPYLLPEAPESRSLWAATLARWVDAQVSGRATPVDAAALEAHMPQMQSALRALEAGTRAERASAAEIRRCLDADAAACLEPLTGVSIPSRAR